MAHELDLSRKTGRKGSNYIAIGTYSDFYEGTLRSGWGWGYQDVGLKVLRGGSTRRDFLDEFREKLEKKGAVWVQFNHPHVAKFYGFAYHLSNMPALVLPYYHNGSLAHYLRQNTPSEDERNAFVYQIALGIQYLHSFTPTVVHADIRAANVMLDDAMKAVLVDYELALLVDSTQFTSAHSAGSCRWTAPELMLLSDNDECDAPQETFTKKTDIFAFSMTIIEIFTGERPFKNHKTDTAVIFAIAKGKRPEHPAYSHEMKALVEKCWAQDPSDRPSINDICDALRAIAPSPPSPPLTYPEWFRRRFLHGWL